MRMPPHSDWPIVVGGCHRSGTSLVRRLLDSHSGIYCGPEVKFFSDFYGTSFPDQLRFFRYISTAAQMVGEDELLEVLGRGFVELHERAARAAGKRRWADKVPENVLHCVAWERLLGERWLLVHVVRNPLDTIASLGEAGFLDVPVDPAERALHYRRYVEAGLQFAEGHPDRCFLLIYEDLVSRPAEVLGALMDFVGESLEPSQLAFNAQPHQYGLEDPKIASTSGIHAASLHRWPALLGADEAALTWDLTADLWHMIDPDGRFVEPPPDPLTPGGSPRAARRARRSSTP